MKPTRNQIGNNDSAGSQPANLTFRLGPLVHLPELLREQGVGPDPLLESVGLDPEDLLEPDHRLTYRQGDRLLHAAVEATGCEHLGLLLGQRGNPSLLGIAGFLMRCSKTVGGALSELRDHLGLHEEGADLRAESAGGYTTIGYVLRVSGLSTMTQVEDLAVTMCCQIMRSLCGENWSPSSVSLERRPPLNTTPYRRYFGTSVYFDAPVSELSFPSELLARRVPTADEWLHRFLHQEAERQHGLKSRDLRQALPQLLHRGLLIGRFKAADIADECGLHERTLHRRLQSAGTSFRHELDRVRRSRGEQLLAGTRLPVNEIAGVLGYANSSGFIRAFRRWRGVSPMRWRIEQGPGRR
jgi:AraC-like DNA-binding protein